MTILSLFKNSSKQNNTLIYGSDNFLNDYVVESISKEDRFNSFDKITIDCEVDGLDELIAVLTEASLFSSQRLITVKNPFFLTAKSPKKYESQVKQLLQIFQNSNNLDDVIIIEASYENIDRRKKISKAAVANFNVVETQIKQYELQSFIKSLIKLEGYQISQSALQMLLDRSDQVVDIALSNYVKLKNISDGNKLTEKLIDSNIDMSLAQNIFAILESAFGGKYSEAVKRLDDQLREGVYPVQLIAVFQNQIELLLMVKVLSKRGRSEMQIVKELGVHPYRVKLALKSRATAERLKQLLNQLIELEFKYKSGIYRDNSFIKLFVLGV